MMDINDDLAGRRAAMTLYSGLLDVYSHSCRIILQEKDIECTTEYIKANDDPALLGELNPYAETPTLHDRDLMLYGVSVIIEYLDERFPHPPMMPVDPITRGKARLTISRLRRDWLRPITNLGELSIPVLDEALKKSIRDGLTALSPLMAEEQFFLGQDYSLVDAYLAPLLWRLPAFGIELPDQAEPLEAYSQRIFSREGFRNSLSPLEVELR